MDEKCKQQDKGLKDDAEPEPQVDEWGVESGKGP